ncbi:MAG: hypothetical protein PHN74_00295 [Candidatus Pacebacteria bacterium]|nr:hypothetical protein [Candidatus Paceibacterota bacterium]
MYDFLLQTFIMASLAVMIYLIAKTIPRVSELATTSEKKGFLESFFKKIPWHKIDFFLESMGEKMLRKLKVFLLRIDNVVSKRLNKFRTADNEKANFKPDIFGGEKEVENKSENNTIKE